MIEYVFVVKCAKIVFRMLGGYFMQKNHVSFFSEYSKVELKAFEVRDEAKLKILFDTKEFANKCSYIKVKSAEDVCYYSWDKRSEEICRILGCSDTLVRNIRRKISDALYDVLGKDYLDMIDEGSRESLRQCYLRLSIADSNVNIYNYFPRELVDIINRSAGTVKDFDTKDCRNEFLFLKRISLSYARNALSDGSVDPAKVEYMLRVLEGKAGTVSDTFNFLRSLDVKN